MSNDRCSRSAAALVRRGETAPIALRPTVLWAAWNGIISLAWRPDSLRHDQTRLRELLETATDVIADGLRTRG